MKIGRHYLRDGTRVSISGLMGMEMRPISLFLSAGLALIAAIAIAQPSVLASADAELKAQNDLAVKYEKGDGVPKDLAKARELYEKAATAGAVVAHYNLAYLHDMGLGTPQDRKLANTWYRKAAEKGYAPAMLNLGLNIASGHGEPADLIEGAKWTDLARFFTQRDKDMDTKWGIRRANDALKKQLTPEQFREAEKRANVWLENFRTGQRKS